MQCSVKLYNVRAGADIGNIHQVPNDQLFGQHQDLHSNRFLIFEDHSSETQNSIEYSDKRIL